MTISRSEAALISRKNVLKRQCAEIDALLTMVPANARDTEQAQKLAFQKDRKLTEIQTLERSLHATDVTYRGWDFSFDAFRVRLASKFGRAPQHAQRSA